MKTIASRSLSVIAVVLFLLILPATSYAQTDQPIVLTCTEQDGTRQQLTLNRPTAVLEMWIQVPSGDTVHTVANGTVTSMTDQQIRIQFQDGFDPSFPDAAVWILDRYSLIFGSLKHPGVSSCHKQQRQL